MIRSDPVTENLDQLWAKLKTTAEILNENSDALQHGLTGVRDQIQELHLGVAARVKLTEFETLAYARLERGSAKQWDLWVESSVPRTHCALLESSRELRIKAAYAVPRLLRELHANAAGLAAQLAEAVSADDDPEWRVSDA